MTNTSETVKLDGKPIIFTVKMVNAIMAGQKTQTRRMSELKKINANPGFYAFKYFTRFGKIGCAGMESDNRKAVFYSESTDEFVFVKMPCETGMKLWVRETFFDRGKRAKTRYLYCADYDLNRLTEFKSAGYRWKPSMDMSRTASRITLEITDIGVERLRDISEDDARAEGVQIFGGKFKTFRRKFARSWDSIYSTGSWDKNPWVWKITFSEKISVKNESE